MEKKVKVSKSEIGKSSLKSPSKRKNSPKKTLQFDLDPQNWPISKPSESTGDCAGTSGIYQNAGYTTVHSPAKKRKKDIKIPKVLGEMQEEIEKQWDYKAEKSNLTVLNVKSILKSVITNKYVVDMVRQTVEEGGVTDVPFGPKLTRAKTKELLKQTTDAILPPVVGFLTPVKDALSEVSPDVKLLIDKDLAEDSSDEEYNPENEDEQSEEEERADTSAMSDLDSMPPTPASIPAPLTPIPDSQDGFKVPQENVGQRTRSKLSLNRLPLESLEQAFVPPDVTHDMYDGAEHCDNPDWHQFLKEFTQPLPPTETLDDDIDSDPEYNILEDEEGETQDKEEMRKDRAVKVSKKELNALMAELFDYTNNLSSGDEEDARASESIADLEKSIIKETEERQKLEAEKQKLEEMKKKEELKRRAEERRGFLPAQRLLLVQQLRQHVQLTTQHFLQTYKHPTFHRYAETSRTMLTTLSGLKNDKVCCQQVDNISTALDTVASWEELHRQPETGQTIRRFITDQLEIEKKQKKLKKNAFMQFPKELMELVVESEAFLYPGLLPLAPFRTTLKATGLHAFTPSEDMLLAICLEQVAQLMDENKDLYKKRRMVNMAELITKIAIPRSNPRCISGHIRHIKSNKKIGLSNPIKNYFETGRPPTILHYVVSVQQGVKLSQLPLQLLPDVWKNYLINKKQHCIIPESLAGKKSDLPEVNPSKTLNKDCKQIKTKQKCVKLNGQIPKKTKKDFPRIKFKRSKHRVSTKTVSTVNHKECNISSKTTKSLPRDLQYSVKCNGVTNKKNEHCLKYNGSTTEEKKCKKMSKVDSITVVKRTNFPNQNTIFTNCDYVEARMSPNKIVQCNTEIACEAVTTSIKTVANGLPELGECEQISDTVLLNGKKYLKKDHLKPSNREVPHCPKPPSTVKLKLS